MNNEFDKEFLDNLLKQARSNPLSRKSFVLNNTQDLGSQRKLNALLPETKEPMHCHPKSSENVLCLRGRLDEVIYSISPEPSAKNVGCKFEVKEVARYHLCPAEGRYGCQIPAGTWHKIEVLEPSVIYETRDGRYKEDGTAYLDDYKSKKAFQEAGLLRQSASKLRLSDFLQSLSPSKFFTLSMLPYWSIVVLDCVTIVLSGMWSVYQTLGTLTTVEHFWDYVYIWLFSLPMFLLALVVFRSYRGMAKKTKMANLVSIFVAMLIGGMVLQGFCQLMPSFIVPFRPALPATLLMIVVSSLLMTLYRIVGGKMFYINANGEIKASNPFKPANKLRGEWEDLALAQRKRVNLCLAHMSEEGLERKYVAEAFDKNWVVPLGPNVNAFEQSLKEYVMAGVDVEEPSEVAALSAGTAAIHLALRALDVMPGDEVCVQTFTFCASANPIIYQGATPIFIDSEPDTWNMDPDLLERAIKDRMLKTGRKPKAIIPVSLYGMPYDVDRIMEIANRYSIPVIEDAAEGLGSRYKGRVLGTFGQFGVLSFNGNKMITTSGGGALVCNGSGKHQNVQETADGDQQAEEVQGMTPKEAKSSVLWYATQAREAYPYYQHESIGYNYRMSNVCAGIGRGQMSVLDAHIEHHRHVQALYEQLLSDVKGIKVHKQPVTIVKVPDGNNGFKDVRKYDSNYWLCTITLDPSLKIKGQENAYRKVVSGAVGGAAGVVHTVASATTDCQPNNNVEALRVLMDAAQVEVRPLWKPMHRQPVFAGAPAYVNGVSESLFKVGLCLPAGPCVSDDDVQYICKCICEAIVE